MKDTNQENKKKWLGFSAGVSILLVILVFWLLMDNADKASALDDYKTCAESCASDNELCIVYFSSRIQDYYTCVNGLNACWKEWSGTLDYVNYCLKSYNPCVEKYLGELDMEATTCSDDLTSCVDDCGLE